MAATSSCSASVFSKIAACARAERFAHDDLVVVLCKDQHLDVRCTQANLARGFNAVDPGKRVVENGHVRLGGNGLVDGLFAVSSLGDDSPARVTFDDASDTRAHHGMIISDQDAGHGQHARGPVASKATCCCQARACWPRREELPWHAVNSAYRRFAYWMSECGT